MEDLWAFTVRCCDIGVHEFWELSWYEWSIIAGRHNVKIERLELIDEGHWARFRIQWADFRNANRAEGDSPVEPQDLIKLRFDSDKKEPEKQPTFKELKGKLGSKFKPVGGE
jgi:hypothetical protein